MLKAGNTGVCEVQHALAVLARSLAAALLDVDKNQRRGRRCRDNRPDQVTNVQCCEATYITVCRENQCRLDGV